MICYNQRAFQGTSHTIELNAIHSTNSAVKKQIWTLPNRLGARPKTGRRGPGGEGWREGIKKCESQRNGF